MKPPVPSAEDESPFKILVDEDISGLQKQMRVLAQQGWRPAVGAVSFVYAGKSGFPNKLRLFIVLSRLVGGKPVEIIKSNAKKKAT